MHKACYSVCKDLPGYAVAIEAAPTCKKSGSAGVCLGKARNTMMVTDWWQGALLVLYSFVVGSVDDLPAICNDAGDRLPQHRHAI